MEANRFGSTIPAHRKLTAERRVVTILFSDVTGSTAMAENLDPEEWAEIMNEAFEYLTAPVIHYGGTVARLMGDAVLAFFGAPTAHEDDPLRAILAGLEIQERIKEFRQRISAEYGMDFNVRVGINTGIAVVGEMGTALAGEYTAMGDAVNLAARMEQSAAPGTIQITHETYRLAAPWIEVESLGGLEVKGKSEPVAVYRVLGRKKLPASARGISGIRSPLVGRDQELASMVSLAEHIFQGKGQILFLVGEAGLGKSRLIEELQTELQRRQEGDFLWINARGISYEMARPYGLFVQAVRKICQINDDDPADVLQKKIGESFANLSLERRSGIIRTMELLLTFDHGSDQAAPIVSGEALKREIFSSMWDIWSTRATEEPLILVFDDLHWADQASVDLIGHLFPLVEQVPILFLCAFRPHRQAPAWQLKGKVSQFERSYLEINLAPLGEGDSNQLVENLLHIPDLQESIRTLILNKSEGNPFFVEELVRTLIEKQIVLSGEDGLGWRVATDFEEINIPDNLHALLLARIDRLEEDSRLALQMASVIGRVFSLPVLAELSTEIQDLEHQLAVLQRSGLIELTSSSPEPEYIFRHELTREAAYRSILKRQRREIHRQVGQAIEKIYAGKLAEEAYRLAYHYNEARDYSGALKYYQIAGKQSLKLFANREAGHYFQQAIQLALRLNSTSVQLAQLFLLRGRALELANDYDDALDNYEELEELGRTRHDRSLELAALIPQATIYSTLNVNFNPQVGAELSRRALNLAIDLREYEAEAKSLWSLMLIETFSDGDLEQSVRYGEQGLRIAREHDLQEVKAYIQHDLARPYMRLGRLEESWEAYQSSQEYWREVENLPMLADNLASLAESFYNAGEFDRSLSHAEEGARISEEIGNLWGMAYNSLVIGPILIERGQIDESILALEKTRELSREANFAAGIIASEMMQSWLFAMLGDLERARLYESRIKEFVERYDTFQPLYKVNQAQNEMYAGNIETAIEMIEQIGLEYTTSSELIFHPFIYTLHVEIYLENGDNEAALNFADHYLNSQQRNQVKILFPDLLNQKARALVGLGEFEQAYEALVSARSLAEEQNSRRILWAIMFDLAELESDKLKADELRQEAGSILGYIHEHISDPRLRQKFLDLERVRKLKI